MTKFKTLRSLLLVVAVLSLGACTKDITGEPSASSADENVAEKLVFSPENAIKGQLLVYFSDDVVSKVENSVLRVTRAGGVATRSGIDDFDGVLDNIGVKSLERLFPVDERNEERTRAAGLHRWYVVEFDEGADLQQAAHAMARVAEVSKVEYNQQLKNVDSGQKIIPMDLPAAPATRAETSFNDPLLGWQWHYINKGNTTIYNKIKAGADVNCEDAWRLCAGDPRVIVAVVDDCVDWTHPDLAANMWTNTAEEKGQTGADDDSNGYKDDIHGYNFVTNTTLKVSTQGDAPEHGTHVGGTVAAVNNNGVGVCGVAGGTGNNDGVKLMSCQIFYNGDGGTSSISAKAIKYAADNGASILQCSWGYEGGYLTSDASYAASSSVEKQAIDYFISTKNCDALDGGLAIFAAGNDATGMAGYPAAYKDYIAVTSMSCDFTPAYYTNYGPGCNIAAPGGDMVQSYLDNGRDYAAIYSTIPNGRYGYSQGTSMACPHVSGVAALGLSYALKLGKTFTTDQFKALLLTSVNNIDQYCTGTKTTLNDNGSPISLALSTYSKKMGTGYIDAFQVLMNVRGTTCVPVPVSNNYQLDLLPYLGGGNTNLTIVSVEFSAEDLARIGMASNPVVFGNKVFMQCTKPGSAIGKVTMRAGTNSGSGVNGMTITKEMAFIVREAHSENGGWL